MQENEMRQPEWIAGLIHKYLNNSLSEQEMEALTRWRNAGTVNQKLFHQLTDRTILGDALLKMEETDTALHIRHIFSKAGMPLPADNTKVIPVRSKIVWQWAAAAALITAIAGTAWFFLGTAHQPPAGVQITEAEIIAPGRDKAVLTLADGSQVVLDSITQDVIKERGNVNILSKDGRLVYDASRFSGGAEQPISINTITTPRG
ncbi:MAG TPA: hypothetical protein PLL71_18990, partial [Agriterribacter sp.]|nr:hypothetical protein [Agriterribacter sp.]